MAINPELLEPFGEFVPFFGTFAIDRDSQFGKLVFTLIVALENFFSNLCKIFSTK